MSPPTSTRCGERPTSAASTEDARAEALGTDPDIGTVPEPSADDRDYKRDADPPDEVWCLGDLVGYNADSDAYRHGHAERDGAETGHIVRTETTIKD